MISETLYSENEKQWNSFHFKKCIINMNFSPIWTIIPNFLQYYLILDNLWLIFFFVKRLEIYSTWLSLNLCWSGNDPFRLVEVGWQVCGQRRELIKCSFLASRAKAKIGIDPQKETLILWLAKWHRLSVADVFLTGSIIGEWKRALECLNAEKWTWPSERDWLAGHDWKVLRGTFPGWWCLRIGMAWDGMGGGVDPVSGRSSASRYT